MPVELGARDDLSRGFVQRGHGCDSAVDPRLFGAALLQRGCDDPCPQGLGEDQRVAGPRCRVPQHAIWIDQASDGVAELDLRVPNTVAAYDCATGELHHRQAATKDLLQDCRVAVLWKAY